MFGIGTFRAAHCQGVSRRAFVQAGLLSPFALGMGASLAAGQEYGAAKAKSVIFLFLWGGPSHIDTFDPKPLAPAAYRGPFATIKTKVPGIQFTELFPRLAAQADKLAVVRSHQTFDGGHLGAGCLALTGDRQTKSPGPSFGSVLARFRGGELPPYIMVGRRKLRDAGDFMKGTGGGTWGPAYDPFPLQCEDDGTVQIPGLKLLDGLTPERLTSRGELLREIDDFRRDAERGSFAKWNHEQQKAFNLLSSDSGRQAFDLSRESETTRGKYGRTAFGQSCLLARRLAEVGVPYIQVNWSEYVEPYFGDKTDYGWDTHQNNFELLNDRHGPILDRALSGLITDLDERGMLDSTLIVAMGEFGRTPRIDGAYSRGHHPNCYSSLWAGAGIRPGVVVGQSDKYAHAPLTEPITPAMVGTTILDLAGIAADTRAQFRILPDGHVIHELCS